MSTAAPIAPGLPAGPGPQPPTAAGAAAESGFDFAGLLAPPPPAEALAATLPAGLEPAPEALPDTAAEPLAGDNPFAALFGPPLPSALPPDGEETGEPAAIGPGDATRTASVPLPPFRPGPAVAPTDLAPGSSAPPAAARPTGPTGAGPTPAPLADGMAIGGGAMPASAAPADAGAATAALAAVLAASAPPDEPPRPGTAATPAAPTAEAAASPLLAATPAAAAPRFAALADLPPLHTPRVDAGDFADSLGARLTWMAEHRIGRAEIRVSPPELGAIDITLKLDGKQVRAEFASAHADVRAALEAGLPRLRDMMAGQGLTLTHAEVGGQGAGGQSAARGGEAAAPAAQPAGRAAAGSEDEDAARPGAATSRHDGLLDEYA